jgi:dienelactone hydrolase
MTHPNHPSHIPADLDRLYTIGGYGPWAAAQIGEQPGSYSWRNDRFDDLNAWRDLARARVLERMAQPDLGRAHGSPTVRLDVRLDEQFEYDGLHMERLSWQLPYGPRTQALLLKPQNHTENDAPLSAVLALHCHSGMKAFGLDKITRTPRAQHPMMEALQQRSYGGRAWANELAKRGYVVLVSDAFAFGSRRVRVDQVHEAIRDPHATDSLETLAEAEAYNRWAANHESVMAKALFSAGLTWPGVFSAEDQAALDVLCARPDVDVQRVGCGGLSGGGLRTVLLAGLDDRVRCAVCMGMMTTWRDYAVNRCHTHTWMCYVPGLPPELDYPEILGLRVPLPTLVQNNTEDPLFTRPEMERAEEILAGVYAKAGEPSAFACQSYPGPHKFDQAMQADAFAWFDRWLQA